MGELETGSKQQEPKKKEKEKDESWSDLFQCFSVTMATARGQSCCHVSNRSDLSLSTIGSLWLVCSAALTPCEPNKMPLTSTHYTSLHTHTHTRSLLYVAYLRFSCTYRQPSIVCWLTLLCSCGFSFIFLIKLSTSDRVLSKRFLVCQQKHTGVQIFPQKFNLQMGKYITSLICCRMNKF